MSSPTAAETALQHSEKGSRRVSKKFIIIRHLSESRPFTLGASARMNGFLLQGLISAAPPNSLKAEPSVMYSQAKPLFSKEFSGQRVASRCYEYAYVPVQTLQSIKIVE